MSNQTPTRALGSVQPRTAPMAVFASSAIGFAAVDAVTGALRWQRREETEPGTPIATPQGDLWLPGRCAAHGDKATDAVLGCVDITTASGTLLQRSWVQPVPPTVPARGRRSRALGRWGERLLWARGPDVAVVDMPGGNIARVLRAPESIAGDVCSWATVPATATTTATATATTTATATATTIGAGASAAVAVAACDGLMAFANRDRALLSAPRWYVSVPRMVGVAGPVHAGPGLVWVRDNTLEARSLVPVRQSKRRRDAARRRAPSRERPLRSTTAWTATGHYAYAPGTLAVTADHKLVAMRIDSGVRPVILDPASGRHLAAGEIAPGRQVLAAATWERGLIAAVRLDTGLRRDAVIAWNAALDLVWAWPLPTPPRARTEPVGLAVCQGEAIVFYDGRYAARVGAATSEPAAPEPATPESDSPDRTAPAANAACENLDRAALHWAPPQSPAAP